MSYIDTPNGKKIPVISRSLRQDEWLDLNKREAEITQELQPAQPRDTANEVNLMLRTFGNYPRDVEDVRVLIAGYNLALQDAPLWAIKQACKKWILGDVPVGPSRFAPSAPELRMTVGKILEPLRIELKDISDMKVAETRKDDAEAQERQRVMQAFDDLKAELTASAPKDESKNLDEARRIDAELTQRFFESDCRVAGVDPEKGVSGSLMRLLGHLKSNGAPHA